MTDSPSQAFAGCMDLVNFLLLLRPADSQENPERNEMLRQRRTTLR